MPKLLKTAWMRILLLAAFITVLFWGISLVREAFQSGSGGSSECPAKKNCKDCAETGGCVWCPNAQKCSAQDRMGFPRDSECDKALFVTFSDKCDTMGAKPTGEPAAPNPLPQPLPDTRGGSGANCPSTTKAVEDVMKVLEPTIKDGVKKEMTKYGIAMKEGFQTQNPMANMAVAEVRDSIREIVRRSVMASPAPAPAPAAASV